MLTNLIKALYFMMFLLKIPVIVLDVAEKMGWKCILCLQLLLLQCTLTKCHNTLGLLPAAAMQWLSKILHNTLASVFICKCYTLHYKWGVAMKFVPLTRAMGVPELEMFDQTSWSDGSWVGLDLSNEKHQQFQ